MDSCRPVIERLKRSGKHSECEGAGFPDENCRSRRSTTALFYIRLHIKHRKPLHLYAKAYNMESLSEFVKKRRRQAGMTQEDFAERAGVALTVIRKIEQGKDNLSLAKVKQVLLMFGHTVGPIKVSDAAGDR